MIPTGGASPSSAQLFPHVVQRPTSGEAIATGPLTPTPRARSTAGRPAKRAATALLAALLGLGATLLASPAAADDGKEDPLNHEEQFGLRIGLTLPFKVNFRYDDSPPCATRNPTQEKKVCPVGAPLALDIAASYALTGSIEPFVWGRIGLGDEIDTSTSAAAIVGAGLRLYTRNTARFKIFLQPAVAAEFEGPTVDIPGRNWETDFLAQVHIGGQYDFTRHVGAYLSLGPSVAVVRAMSLGIEGSLGVQARFP